MFDFPASPTNGQTVTGAAGQMYVFNGTAWTAQNVAGPFVKIAGDTMSGALVLTAAAPSLTVQPASGQHAALYLNKPASGVSSLIRGQMAGTTRWTIEFGNSFSESGANTGSDFNVSRFSDAGAYIDNPIVITRSTGDMTLSGNLLPQSNNTKNLGSSSLRWATVYTADLSLNNGVGDWTLVEGEDDLFLYNNKKGKTYKFTLTEVDPSTVPPKKAE